jgi:ribosome-associated heat shock protein Hsp15
MVYIKPSKEVFSNEKINIRKNQITYEIVILDIPKSRMAAKLVDLYRKDVTPKEAFENQELLKYSKDSIKYIGKKNTKNIKQVGIWAVYLLLLKHILIT